MLLHCEVSEAYTKPVLLVGWCGGERLTDKQSVTAPLSSAKSGQRVTLIAPLETRSSMMRLTSNTGGDYT